MPSAAATAAFAGFPPWIRVGCRLGFLVGIRTTTACVGITDALPLPPVALSR